MDLVYNLSLLVSLSVVSSFITSRWYGHRREPLFQGLLFGIIAVTGMLNPLDMGPGLIFDGRSVVISLGSLYFGPAAALLSGSMATALRLYQGGSGAVMGVSVIVASAAAGLVYRRWMNSRTRIIGNIHLLMLGFVVHVIMVGLLFTTLPFPKARSVFSQIGLIVLLIYPFAELLIGQIIGSQQKRLRLETERRKTELRLKKAQEIANVGWWEYHISEDREYWSEETKRLFWAPSDRDTYRYSDFERIIHPEDHQRVNGAYWESIKNREKGYEIDHRICNPDTGEVRYVIERCEHQKNDNGTIVASLGMVKDITDLRLKERELQKNLKEKEILLQEVNHRVKNNLNIISSLLSLQASRIETKEDALRAFKNTSSQIHSMAMVHKELYRTQSWSRIRLDSYLDKIVTHLQPLFDADKEISLSCELQEITVPVSIAIPCGLIVNELVTNSYKYAFPEAIARDDFSPRLSVELNKGRDEDLTLTVRDNGIGFSEADGDGALLSLGMRLIQLLTKQLNGTLKIVSEEGTYAEIRIPHPEVVKPSK